MNLSRSPGPLTFVAEHEVRHVEGLLVRHLHHDERPESGILRRCQHPSDEDAAVSQHTPVGQPGLFTMMIMNIIVTSAIIIMMILLTWKASSTAALWKLAVRRSSPMPSAMLS
jgi:hypothetical protein